MLFLQVVADAGDCAVLVKVLHGAARWQSGSSWTSGYFSKLFQIFLREQIWKMQKTHLMDPQCVCMSVCQLYRSSSSGSTAFKFSTIPTLLNSNPPTLKQDPEDLSQKTMWALCACVCVAVFVWVLHVWPVALRERLCKRCTLSFSRRSVCAM